MKTDEPIRITNASASRAQDIARRQRNYLWAMSLRTICFVAALVASASGIGWLWPILVLGAIVLPYFAVVAANAANDMSDGFRLREIPASCGELEPKRDTDG